MVFKLLECMRVKDVDCMRWDSEAWWRSMRKMFPGACHAILGNARFGSETPASNPAESTFAHVLHVSPTFPK